MGNQICCQETTPQPHLPPLPEKPTTEGKLSSIIQKPSSVMQVPIPPVSKSIQDYIDSEQPYKYEFNNDAPITRFGNDVYYGPLDQHGRPDGIGRMYKNNGALFIGNFTNGVANGQAHYIFPDGSYYRGNMVNNKAETKDGTYVKQSPYLQYRGGFQNNTFHGKGFEKGHKHEYEGSYVQGKKNAGKLKWDTVSGNRNKYEYEYDGTFDDQGRFHGQGRLKEIKGTYEGGFNHGLKEGKGVYYYESGIKYVGEYQNGQKHGRGTIYGDNGKKSYDGQWSKGIPDGKGIVYNDQDESPQETELKEGIDVRLL